MTTLSAEPLIPASLWVALAIVGAALLGWYGLGRPRAVSRSRWTLSIALMAAGLAAVLVILLNPTWVIEVPPPEGKPLLTVLVDSSASMATTDAPGNHSRYQKACDTAARLAKNLAGRFDVRLRTFAAGVAPAEAPALTTRRPEGRSTDLTAALNSGLDEERPQGQAMVVLTDGIHNAGGGTASVLDSARQARSMAVPVYCDTIGGDAPVRDVTIELPLAQELAFAGQHVMIACRVRQRGMNGGRTAVVLRLNDRELDRQEIAFASPEPVTVRFETVQPDRGSYSYVLQVLPLPGEATPANNSADFLLRVVDEPIHVLFLEGKPYWDGKFLARTLVSDPLVELDSVVRITGGRFIRQTYRPERKSASSGPAGSPATAPAGPAAPLKQARTWSVLNDPAAVLAKPETLRNYQVVVLGRDAEAFLPQASLDNLRDWIATDGGALVCSRGAPVAEVNQRLAKLLPVEWSPTRETRFTLQLTDLGRDLNWLAGREAAEERAGFIDLPTLATITQVTRTKTIASVLAVASSAGGPLQAPAISYQPYGIGRVVVLEGAGMWRWAFLPPEYRDREGLYDTLWHSLLRWLACGEGLLPGQNVTLRADKLNFSTTEAATASLRVRDTAAKPPAIELSAANRTEKTTVLPVAIKDEPDTFRVVFGKLPAGCYRARATGRTANEIASEAMFFVADPIDEPLDLKARPELMARVAEISGGAALKDASPEEISARFREHQTLARMVSTRRMTAWDRWWVLIAVFVVWGTTWGLRRSGGLI